MEPFIGAIQLFPYDFAPRGWVRCEGQRLTAAQNSSLFALIGNRFGGERQTFNLPDMRGKEPVPGTAYHIAVDGMFPSRH